jgi:DtxR family manganese transport transcriptional regulator
METAGKRALHFQKVRRQHLCELIEDYTEMIADLIEAKGKVRVCDLAREMGVSHVNVIKTIKKLVREGYLVENMHPLIDLTPKGQELASYSKKRHLILFHFLRKLGVPENIAAEDVEGLEHHISPETLNALETHLYC